MTTIQQLKLESLQEVVVPLNEKEPFFNTTYTEDNGIQINESGFYLVSYYLGASPTDSCTVTVTVKDDNTVVPSSNVNCSI